MLVDPTTGAKTIGPMYIGEGSTLQIATGQLGVGESVKVQLPKEDGTLYTFKEWGTEMKITPDNHALYFKGKMTGIYIVKSATAEQVGVTLV